MYVACVVDADCDGVDNDAGGGDPVYLRVDDVVDLCCYWCGR